jgi:hypothetical protein
MFDLRRMCIVVHRPKLLYKLASKNLSSTVDILFFLENMNGLRIFLQ